MLIHVIGDSHVGIFIAFVDKKDIDLPPFKTHYIAGATAHHLKDSHSSSNSNVDLFKSLNEINKDEDIVLLWFGEIDCRSHIGQLSEENKKPIDTLLDNTVSNYSLVFKIINDMGVRFAVIGMPPCNREIGFPDDEKKRQIYKGFNDRLRKVCIDNNYKYIDVFDVASDINGFISPYYMRSNNCQWFYLEKQNFGHEGEHVHLNHRIIPHILEQINTLFNTKLYIEIKGY